MRIVLGDFDMSVLPYAKVLQEYEPSYRPALNKNFSVSLLCADEGLGQTLAALLRLEGFTPHVYRGSDDFLLSIRQNRPAFVIISPEADGSTSVNVARQVKDMRNGVPRIVLLNKGTAISVVTEFMRLGAREVFELPFVSEDLLKTVRDLVRREIRIVPTKRGLSVEVQGWSVLTDREIEVVHHICDGLSNKDVGAVLGISSRTVEVHRAKAMLKLGANNVAELVRRMMT